MKRRWLAFGIWLTTPSPDPVGWRAFALVFLITIAVSASLVHFGAWWGVWLMGLALGRSFAPAGRAIVAGGISGLLGWSLHLAWEHWRYGLGPTAQSLAAIMGFTHQPAVPIILTCLVAFLLGLTGAWVGAAARIILTPRLGR